VVVVKWVVVARKALLATITMVFRTQVVRVSGGRGAMGGSRSESATANDNNGV